MIPLMRYTFYNEDETKRKLCEFIKRAQKLSMGEQVEQFEKRFAAYQGRKHAVMYNSGSSANLALIQTLVNLGRLKKGDAVGFSAVTWATNVMPIMQLGLTPVPIDVSLKTLNVSSEELKKTLATTSLKCLFITNLLGFCDDLDEIEQLCAEKGIILLEDNCESLGSEHAGKKLGNFSLASTFSTYVGHHMSTVEGGIVCTDDDSLHEMLIMVRAHGWDRNLPKAAQERLRKEHKISPFKAAYTFYTTGYNLRPTELQGFLGNEQMQYLGKIHAARSENYRAFSIAAASNKELQAVDATHMDFTSNFAFPVVCPDQKTFERYLKTCADTGIETRPIVGGSMTEQPFFKESPKQGSCPNAKKVFDLGFYLPNHPDLSLVEIETICTVLRGA